MTSQREDQDMPNYEQSLHRRSIRIKGYDYTQPGAYFLTLVTQNSDCLFGEIHNGIALLNEFGKVVQKEWTRLNRRFQNVELDEYVIMPNHMHGIIVLADRDKGMGDYERAQDNLKSPRAHTEAFGVPVPGSIPTIMRSFKSSVTQHIQWMVGRGTGITGRSQIPDIQPRAPTKVWQRNYYEHIIRSMAEWERIKAYIRDNPQRWMEDRENPLHR